jgi:deazaflavin-dependent oxidoreductase (nitroreductase family)
MPLLARVFIQLHALLYRASNGRIASRMRGQPLLVLTTRGAKSGAKRHVPVAPFIEGDHVYVIASIGGAPKHPGWYHNLKANPDVGVQLLADKYRARARVLPEPERSEVWNRIVTAMPGFGEYQKKTKRVIPVVQLIRA